MIGMCSSFAVTIWKGSYTKKMRQASGDDLR